MSQKKRQHVLLLNGPNLHLLGQREPHLYGKITLAELEKSLIKKAKDKSMMLSCEQSNSEGGMLGHIHDAIKNNKDGIIINAGGLTHTSIVIMDALLAFSEPIVEVHITNVMGRESFRHRSYVSRAADGVITGFGVPFSYVLAVDAMEHLLAQKIMNP